MTNLKRLETVRVGVVAGVAGGLAEIAWVMLYSGLSGAAVVARGVAAVAGVNAVMPDTSPVMLGIGVHMMLAEMLGVGLCFAWQALSARRCGSTNPYAFMLSALAGVWAINFFVVLPVVSPAFVHLVPYAVSLMSKLLFGAAAAAIVSTEPEFGSREATTASKI